jgi:4-hydroxybenzoate polyprenyltransferase
VTEALRFQLKASRPGLWFPTLWLYMLPLAGEPLGGLAFWVGLLWCGFPLNHLVYGWNDCVDAETDRQNPRKDSWLFGARGTDAQLAALPRAIAAVQLATWPVLVWVAGWQVVVVGAAILTVLWAYNHPSRGLRGRPPGDLLAQAGYLLVVPLSALVNDQPLPGWGVMAYLALFCAQAQLIGEVMDIEPDRAAGRRTTATVLGARGAKWLIILVVVGEIAMLAGPLADPVFAGGMAGFLGWLLLDQLVLFRDGQYTLGQMKLFGVGGNLCALASMAWVWLRGGLGA